MRREADKRGAVNLLMSDTGWSQWSDRKKAQRCVVDQRSVGRLWRQLLSGDIPQIRGRKVGRGDAVYEMKTRPVNVVCGTASIVSLDLSWPWLDDQDRVRDQSAALPPGKCCGSSSKVDNSYSTLLDPGFSNRYAYKARLRRIAWVLFI
jgi:hypothetical protein